MFKFSITLLALMVVVTAQKQALEANSSKSWRESCMLSNTNPKLLISDKISCSMSKHSAGTTNLKIITSWRSSKSLKPFLKEMEICFTCAINNGAKKFSTMVSLRTLNAKNSQFLSASGRLLNTSSRRYLKEPL